eukprot:Unigene13202_Nuclearia_a/m.39997 Unigene13202_Nuclearia_a/g.39997  ORF Unigene13202_Nuclearia_a/g.39997 Unigene13202_Nuclearia_a/m.39997 type:complete len:362 (-) Unigene13202_Nuclearia_a:117-1202(-)
MNTAATASYSAVPSMLTVLPSGSTKRAVGSEMPLAMACVSVTGSVAEDDAVPNAVSSACDTPAMYLYGLRRVKANCSAGRNSSPWMSRPTTTVAMYSPSDDTTAQKPLPLAARRPASSEKTPTGVKNMTQCTRRMKTVLLLDTRSSSTRPSSPVTEAAAAKAIEKVISPSISILTIEPAMFSGKSDMIIAIAASVPSVVPARGGTVPPVPPSAISGEPGWMAVTRTRPRTTATSMVQAKSSIVRTASARPPPTLVNAATPAMTLVISSGTTRNLSTRMKSWPGSISHLIVAALGSACPTATPTTTPSTAPSTVVSRTMLRIANARHPLPSLVLLPPSPAIAAVSDSSAASAASPSSEGTRT